MLLDRLQKRVDRCFYKMKDFVVQSIELVGKEPIPDLRCEIVALQTKDGGEYTGKPVSMPVYPSDHFELLVKIMRNMRNR